MEQEAEPAATAHRLVSNGWRERDWSPLLEALVGSGPLVEGGILGQHPPEVRCVGDEEVVEALRAERTLHSACALAFGAR